MTAAPESPPRPARSVLALWPLGLALLVALAVRVARVGVRELWLDEACTSLFAQSADLGALVDLLVRESHPPLYYALMQLWVRLFGADEVALRGPSLLAGLALVVLVWRAVRVFGGGRFAASLGAFMAAGSPLLVYYSVEAKAYTLLWALGLGVLLCLRRASEPGGGHRSFWFAAGLTVLALYTHHYALFLLPLWGVAVVAAPRGERLRGVAACVAALAVYAPWAIGFLAGQSQAGGTDWLGAYWHGPLAAVSGSARAMALVPPFPGYLGEFGSVALPAALAWLVGGWFGLPVLLGAGRVSLRGKHWQGLLLVCAAVLPVLLPAAASLRQPIYLVGRYELLAYPAWIVLWSLGLGWLAGRLPAGGLRFAGRAAVAVLTVAGVGATTVPYLLRPADPWQHQLAAQHLAGGEPDDVIVAIGLTRAPLEHQLRLLGDRHTLLSFPPDVAEHVGWFRPERLSDEELARDAGRLAIALAERSAVWLVIGLDSRGRMADPRVATAPIAAIQSTGRRPGAPVAFGQLGLMRLE